MRLLIAAGVAIAATSNAVFAQSTEGQLCAEGSTEINGNYYCQQVDGITFQMPGEAGSYQAPTSMTGGPCPQSGVPYGSGVAPLDEDMSIHFRGPIQLKKFAVYYPSSGSSGPDGTAPSGKKRDVHAAHQRRHGHQHFHQHNKEVREVQERAEAEAEKREIQNREIVATINGKVVSWSSNSVSAAPTSSAVAAPAAAPANASQPVSSGSPSQKSQSSGTPSTPPSGGSFSAGTWQQGGLYDSEAQISTNLVFLNNKGDSGISGTWDINYGNSLSFATSDATGPASSPQILKDMLVPSNTEFAIFAATKCGSGAVDCGFTRPQTVAYEGFPGGNKAFFFQFLMPDDGTSGYNENMPAIWALNAKIPRTLQYGEATCSCWTTGCGEFDFFEVLDSGNTRCKATVHASQSGGSSNYFKRPTSDLMTAAVIFNGDKSTVTLQVIDSFDFGASLSSDELNSILSTNPQSHAIFNV